MFAFAHLCDWRQKLAVMHDAAWICPLRICET
jgi:hypothetical protein